MTRRHHSRSIDELSPAQRRGWGGVLLAMSVGTAWLIRTHPEQLRAPAWVAYAACSAFALTGVALVLHTWLSRRAYAWMMVGVVSLMTAIPAWISMGDGVRHCRSRMTFLRGDTACRMGFGAATLLMLVVCAVAITAALRTSNEAGPSADG